MKFFDRVNGVYITEQLIKWQVPKEMVIFIHDLHRSRPLLPPAKEQLLDETTILEKNELDRAIREGLDAGEIKDHACLRDWEAYEDLKGKEVAEKEMMDMLVS